MRRTFAALAGLLALLIVPVRLSAKGKTVRITIQGAALAAPIEITGQEAADFRVWTGPGTSSDEPQGLIMDWSRGMAKPPEGLEVYQISFLTTRQARNTYVVSYVIDPANNHGYVYLPGKTEAGYADNVWMIWRGVEGNWFHAWSAWEKLAHPLIAKARAGR